MLKPETCLDAASESKDTTCLALPSCKESMNKVNKPETSCCSRIHWKKCKNQFDFS